MHRVLFTIAAVLVCFASSLAQPPPFAVPYYVPPEYAQDTRFVSVAVTTTADENDGSCGGGTGISLREALLHCVNTTEAASISIPDGTYILGSEIATVDKSVYLVGETRSGAIVTSTGGSFRMLNVTLDDDQFGLFNLTVIGFTSPAAPGAVMNATGDGNIIVYNALFETNSSNAGGAVAVQPDPLEDGPLDVTVDSSVFTGNTSTNNAGALRMSGGVIGYNLVILNSMFSANIGGGVNLGSVPVDADVIISNSTFVDNTSTFGGGVQVSTANINVAVIVAHSSFDGNAATNSGGAISVTTPSGGSLSLSNVTATGNSVGSGEGGAVRVLASDVHITESTFTGNTGDRGGALAIGTANTSAQINNSVIQNNRAYTRGGGIFNFAQYLVLSNVAITNNVAESLDSLSGSGGGLAMQSHDIVVQGSRIEDNFAIVEGPDCWPYTGTPNLISIGQTFITDLTDCLYTAHPTDYAGNLIINGGFEVPGIDASSPYIWVGKNLTGDKRKCNKPTKAVTPWGNCALVFKGGPGEAAEFSQDVPIGSLVLTSLDGLKLYGQGFGALTASVVLQIKVTYDDPNISPDKAKLTFDGKGNDVLTEEVVVALVDPDLESIKAKIKYKSLVGKMTIDRVYLSVAENIGPRSVDAGVLPPPTAPDGFRGGN
ncbi:MAG: hypothetical protein IPM16_20715 [Chloroflexi bacterium]|nr:hypothetical protein [Chloroflexota bacterium]